MCFAHTSSSWSGHSHKALILILINTTCSSSFSNATVFLKSFNAQADVVPVKKECRRFSFKTIRINWLCQQRKPSLRKYMCRRISPISNLLLQRTFQSIASSVVEVSGMGWQVPVLWWWHVAISVLLPDIPADSNLQLHLNAPKLFFASWFHRNSQPYYTQSH